MATGVEQGQGRLHRELEARAEQIDELRTALSRVPPQLPSKYFYDDIGSALFEAITRLPEYYPTRCEAELLRTRAGAILEAAGGRVDQLLELGSGAARKTIPLVHAVLGAGRVPHYLALDISAAALDRTQRLLAQEPGVHVELVQADYTQALTLPRRRGPGTRLAVFLGGTLGNEEDPAALRLFGNVRSQLEHGDGLLVGASLVTEPSVIEAAYNDAAGITESFNKNILRHVNAVAGSRFDPDAFEHLAFWNAAQRRIEMWLRARLPMKVDLGAIGGYLQLAEGAGIRTEISRRFTKAELEALLTASGFAVAGWFPSEDGRFALILGQVQTVH